MTQGRWTTLAVLLAALLLAGCGGGGGGGDDGVRQDLAAQLEALMAERDAAKTAQATAAAARAAAEEARATADAARQAADEARATAETERDAALAAQMEAEAVQAEAVAAQAEAEATQAAAEAARDAAVAAKTAAETARDESRDGETQAKIDLIAAQSAQAQAERERDRAEAVKMQAEADQAAAETERDAANTAKQAAETARDDALAAKTQADEALAAARVKAEQDVNAANTKAEADLAALQNRLDDANENLQEAQDDLKEARDDLQTANDEFATVKKERDDAVRDLARAEGTLEGLRGQLTDAQQDAVDAEQRRREAEAEANRRIEQAEQQTNFSLRAPKLITAMNLAATGAGTGGPETATVEHVRGKSLKFEPTGSYTRGSAAPSISGWRSASFSRLRGNDGTETAYLYTNIGSPSRKHFWKVYGEDVVETDSGFETNAKPSSFGSSRWLYQNADGRADRNEVSRRGGTYNGYSGTFSCDTGCNMMSDADGAVTSFDGEWTFEASATAGGTSMQDTEYLYFGIWAFDPKTPSGDHEFRWIAGGGGTRTVDDGTVTITNIDTTNFGALTGTATFNGGAVGKYVLRNQVGQKDSIGTFTAKATFTANFGGSPTLDGRITDFREGGSSLAGWSVYLGMTSSAAAVLTNTMATGEAHASIGGVSATGDWAASLHGSNNPGYTDFGDGADEIECPVSAGCPSADLAGVAGWFDAFSEGAAANSDAAIAGAFAAAP